VTVVDIVAEAVVAGPAADIQRRHGNPVVTVADNYDRLRYEPDAAARDSRYSRYLTGDLMLRAHTSAMIPLALEEVARSRRSDVTILCPGMVYRRDVIDRQHVGEPHQLDIWRVTTDHAAPLTEDDLDVLVDRVVAAVLPGRRWRAVDAIHPYTLRGRQIDVDAGDGWVEVGECGLAHPELLRDAGLPAHASGLASGWGLDRLLMLRKGIEDIRLLRATDPRIERQMHDLEPYEPVSSMPPAIRDLSVVMAEPPDEELLGDRLRADLGADADDVESVGILAVTSVGDLPETARQRLGAASGQHNVLVRVVLRALDRTLTSDEANRLRDRIYANLHEGTVHHWARGKPPA
jgi:phenylalanyl-tRNA synthetase alpha chain